MQCGVGNDTNQNLDSTLNPASLNTITTLSNTVMVLLLQISADDIAVRRKNPIIKPLRNLIRASFVESERAKEEKNRASEITHLFFLLWPSAKKWEPQYNVRGRQVRPKYCCVIGTRRRRGGSI